MLEELVRRFDVRIAIAALGTSCSAIAVASLMLGQQPDFNVEKLPNPSFWTGPLFALLGILAGLAGVAYNQLIIKTCALFDSLARWRPEVPALLIGALVGAIAWYAPHMVGGGDTISRQALVGGFALSALPLIFAVRFLLGPLSYAAGTPGGLFAPILALVRLPGPGIWSAVPAVCGRRRCHPSYLCDRRHGGFFNRNGSSARDWNDSDLRDDRCFQSGIADALGLFRGDGRSHLDGQFAYLRLHEGSHHRRSKDHVMADRRKSRSFRGLPLFSFADAADKNEQVPTTPAIA